jgi:lambda repressor-like predicted transcriptional regulator
MSSRLHRANLDRELARRGWTADDLAVASGVSAATISSARDRRPMRHKTLHKIADALLKAPIVAGVDVL